jgi:hypothetical protein
MGIPKPELGNQRLKGVGRPRPYSPTNRGHVGVWSPNPSDVDWSKLSSLVISNS